MLLRRFNHIEINNLTISEVIAALQAWETENPEALDAVLVLDYDTDAYAEVSFNSPMTELEIQEDEERKLKVKKWREQAEHNEYLRLKAKFEG